jgi:hypothetical protein
MDLVIILISFCLMLLALQGVLIYKAVIRQNLIFDADLMDVLDELGVILHDLQQIKTRLHWSRERELKTVSRIPTTYVKVNKRSGKK